MNGIKKTVGFLISCLSSPLSVDMLIKRFCWITFLFPCIAFAQKPQDLMPPSLAVYLKNDIRIEPHVGPIPNSYDLALKANEKLMEAQRQYTFANTKTKALSSTLSYGNNLISKYIPALKDVNPIEALFEFTANEWTEHANNQDKQQFQTTIEKTFSEYTSAYLQSKPDATATDVSQHFSKFVKSDLVSSENYPIVGKKIDAFLLDYIAVNEKRFDDLQTIVKGKLSGHQNGSISFDEKLSKIKGDLKTENKLAFAKLEKNHWQKLVEYQKSFDNLQSNVINNYKNVYKDINEMKAEVVKNTNEITQNKNDIKRLSVKLASVVNDVEESKKATIDLNVKTEKNRRLIDENVYKTNVIAGVLYNNVDVKGKLQLLETGAVKVADLEKEKHRLKRIDKIESAERYFAIGNQTVELANNIGLSDADADHMGKIIKALSATAKIAKAYETGDVLAGIEGINMGFEVFGKKKAQPNPEFKALMEQFAAVNIKLNVIDKKIDTLSIKLSRMMDMQIALHEETTDQLTQIQRQLDKIEKKADYQIHLLTANNINGINQDFPIEIKRKTDTCRSLSGLRNNWLGIDRLFTVLNAIYNNTIDTNIASKPFLHYNTTDKGSHIQLDLYNPQLEILKTLRNSNSDNASLFYSSLTLLAAKCGSSNDIYNEFMSSKFAKKERPALTKIDLDDLLQPKEITRLTELLLALEPYLYFGEAGSNFKTLPYQEFSKIINAKNESAQLRFKNMLFFCNTALIQQNILNGGPNMELFYQYLVRGMPVDEDTQKNIVKVLNEKNNYYFQSNLSTYILHNAFGGNQTLFNLFNNVYSNSANNESLRKLNDFLHIPNGLLFVGDQKRLFLKLSIPGKSEINLPVQTPLTIFNNDMVYPSDVYDLLDTKVKLTNRLIEYDFIKKTKNVKGLSDAIYSNIYKN
ncbi:hypothetical protein [Mucilaginibacter ginsenosidivorax]|uniref:Uncharacterized protein n=1 Tax=Mucilaginibacter ginsenosidivorax TaxID=862126 RepID=A0A5B8VWE6_9SPHI|nr:hypothetical protein [Mucilaginibacter ginsenosidivorax]QEC75860.1 hypothetical protein FSB76_07835 [Mucilaginibacter ginsenosidivorax]